jgi:syntaxin 18
LQQRTHIAKLHTDLRSIRQGYLSTAHPPRRKQYTRTSTTADKDSKYLTDAQRNEIDAQAKLSIHQLNDAIKRLQIAEQARQAAHTQVALKKRARQGLGALGRWAAGGAITAKSVEEEVEESRANTIKAHRDSIIWSLQNQLEECGRFQSDMMEIRLMREIEKSKSALYKTRNTGPSTNDYSGMNGSSSAGNGSADYRGKTSHAQDESSTVIENQLDPEQLQLFAQENQDMLKQYEDQLDKVRYASFCLSCAHQLTTTAQRRSRSPRSRNCNQRSQPISAYSRRTSTSLWRTRSTPQTTLAAETGSSSVRRSGAVLLRRFSGLPPSSARHLSCGIYSYEAQLVVAVDTQA